MDRHQFASRLSGTRFPEQRIRLFTEWLLIRFDRFYANFLDVPRKAKKAFEYQNHATSIKLSLERLSLYSESIHEIGPFLRAVMPEVSEDAGIWDQIESEYLKKIERRYEADVAYAFMHSVRRIVYRDEWRPVAYSFGDKADQFASIKKYLIKRFAVEGSLTPELMSLVLDVPRFNADYMDKQADAAAISERVSQHIASIETSPLVRVDVIDAGFYRNRGAYIVGRLVFKDKSVLPLIIALLNSDHGVYADAVLLSEKDAHNLFSSTLANFHVTTEYYHELCEFLYSIMPNREVGLHYTTVGYNHLGKVAVLNEVKDELRTHGEVFDTSVGFKGTVAIGFQTPSSSYNLKVIRNHPTKDYKWGEFEGIESVMHKYGQVHVINRTGSMLDNIIYFNIALERDLFAESLLDELLVEASDTVSLQEHSVVFKYLIVQTKLTPLPIFLEQATDEEAAVVVTSLGDCIKNNAAADIFNKDLDGRNYGVSHYLKVYLFDYDALEPFVDVKIRSNVDRFDGEEDIPDWVFEEGVVFLPEEIESGLRLPTRDLRRYFHAVHGDLCTLDYWQRLQDELLAGRVPAIKVYPDICRLEVDRCSEPGPD